MFELCGKYDVMPIEFEIYFYELYEKCSLVSFLPLETLNPFLLLVTPLFYMSLLFLQLFYHLLEFSDIFFVSAGFNFDSGNSYEVVGSFRSMETFGFFNLTWYLEANPELCSSSELVESIASGISYM